MVACACERQNGKFSDENDELDVDHFEKVNHTAFPSSSTNDSAGKAYKWIS